MVSSQEKVNLFIGVIALRIKKNKLEIYILILDYMENHSIAKLAGFSVGKYSPGVRYVYQEVKEQFKHEDW